MQRYSIVVAILLLTSGGRSAQHQHAETPAGGTQLSSAERTHSRFAAQMGEAAERMHRAMATMQPSGHPDRDFLAAMLPHHQGAIDMAKAILLATEDPRIRNLAQSIITEQQYEIELMRTMLAQGSPRSGSEKQ